MKNEFPLYPKLCENGKKEAEMLFAGFKEKFRKIADEVLGELYADVATHIESDSWGNYRSQIMNGMKNYENRMLQGEFDFEEIRRKIYEEHREEIIKDLNQDLVKENEKLKVKATMYLGWYHTALERQSVL